MTPLSPEALAAAIEDADSLMLRWGHGQIRQLPAEERAMIAAALRASVRTEELQKWTPVADGDGTAADHIAEPGEEITFYCLVAGEYYEYKIHLPPGPGDGRG